MPSWHEKGLDRTHGGVLLADDPTRPDQRASEKQIVTQARMVWGFSHAHLNNLGTTHRDYLEVARQGREFLRRHFYDEKNGGYFWTTALDGAPKNRQKVVYGQAFVIYGLVEYYRASGEKSALDEALALYRTLQEKAYDRTHGGWIEHFTEDWRPILDREAGAQVEVAGYKSANTHLHLMEAFTELYEATNDRAVRTSLEEALRINQKYFYPSDASQSCFHRQLDWRAVTDARSAGLSYGHNVEFAWLMIRAQQVLGARPAWKHFYAHLDHALKYGYDHELGGLYSRGAGKEPATQREKIWWVQAEMLAALVEALAHQPNPAYEKALVSLLNFIEQYQADPVDGVWFDTVTREGKPHSPAKAHNWKANYHDVRAIMKFVLAMEGPVGQRLQRAKGSGPVREQR
jgi:mannobiose 2-epimerase